MLRALCILFLLACAQLPRAEATEQIPERFVVDGRVQYVRWVEPLKDKLTGFKKKPFPRQALASNLWRGYVGTWLIEDDALYLHSLVCYAYESDAQGLREKRVEKAIPLTTIFPDAKGPVLASWWSGELVMQQGRLLRDGWRFPRLLQAQRVYLTIENGRVARRLVVDNRKEGRGRSREDTLWVMQANEPVSDDGGWHDARTIGDLAFGKRVPRGTPFRTRGILSVASDGKSSLRVPHTPATDNVYLELANVPDAWKPRTHGHVEIVARYERKEFVEVLRIVSWRKLLPGETIHHPDFEVPGLRLTDFPPADKEPTTAGQILSSTTEVEYLVGRLVLLHGELVVKGKRATVHGVEVAPAAGLGGKEVLAEGVLERWLITESLLEHNAKAAHLFKSRGAGTYYRLAHPTSGALSKPRATKSK